MSSEFVTSDYMIKTETIFFIYKLKLPTSSPLVVEVDDVASIHQFYCFLYINCRQASIQFYKSISHFSDKQPSETRRRFFYSVRFCHILFSFRRNSVFISLANIEIAQILVLIEGR